MRLLAFFQLDVARGRRCDGVLLHLAVLAGNLAVLGLSRIHLLRKGLPTQVQAGKVLDLQLPMCGSFFFKICSKRGLLAVACFGGIGVETRLASNLLK